MRIGIDGNEANIKNRVGVNVYAYNILCNLYKLQDSDKNPKHKYIVYLKSKPLEDLPKEKPWWRYKVLSGSALWIITTLTPHLFMSKEKPEVFFSPSHYTTPVAPVPRVCSIMDLGYLEFSGQFKKHTFWQLKYWSAISIYISKRIIAISNATKEDIVRHYSFASDKVDVTLLAYDKSRFHINIESNLVRRIKNKYAIVDDYVLYLGTLKPSKNVEGLIRGFAKYLELNPKDNKTTLVIGGKKGWMFDSIFEVVKECGLESRILFPGFIDEEDKPALLAGAKLFASPSFWEGFGLHVLEAMACGTPSLVGNVGSLPEVAGEAGVYCDPQKTESIAKGIKNVLTMDEKGYNKLVETGLEQVKEFSWEKTAKETVKVLEGAI